jgi:hypothetical protein
VFVDRPSFQELVTQLKMAAREGLDGLGDYVASMTTFAFYLMAHSALGRAGVLHVTQRGLGWKGSEMNAVRFVSP